MEIKIEDARKTIQREKKFLGIKPFSHNIIGLTLQTVAKDHGTRAANLLIDEFGLELVGWKKYQEV